MTVLRWWAQKVDRQNVIARQNDHYGIPERSLRESRVEGQSAWTVPALDRVGDIHVRMSLELQQAFGLRREEAIKFQPSYADRGDRLVLKDSWTKGGKAREIPVRTAGAARRAGPCAPAGGTRLPDPERAQLPSAAAGLRAAHRECRPVQAARAAARLRAGALRRADRLEIAGGRRADHRRRLSGGERAVDREARLTISRELGHEREQITAVYLGR